MGLEKWVSYHCWVTELSCLGQHTFITSDSMGWESMWHIWCLWLMVYHKSQIMVVAEKEDISRLKQERIF